MADRGAGARPGSVVLLGAARLVGQGEARLSGHAAVLLARLLVHPDRAGCAADLADALWDAEIPASWQSIVRVEASRLRRLLRSVLGEQAGLASGRRGYRVVLPPGARVDVWEAEQLVEQAQRAASSDRHAEALRLAGQAAGLLDQPFLGGLERRWVLIERDRFHRLHRRALQLEAQSAEALGVFEVAIATLEHLRSLDPLDETIGRRLMECHLAQGNRAGALAAYAELRQRLRSDLGVTPSPATEDLYLTTLGTPPAHRRDHEHLPVGPGAPLVGRRAEQEVLVEAWRAAAGGGSALVLVRGEPGSGRSSLLRAALSAPPTAGCAGLLGRFGTPGPPLAPLAAAAIPPGPPCPMPGTPGPELGELLRRPLDQDPPLEQRVAQLLAAWRGLAAQHPTLVALDDADLASAEAQRALELLVRAEPIPGLALVIVVRTGSPEGRPAEGTSRASQLAGTVAGLAGERPVRIVDLEGLPSWAVAELAERVGLRPSPTLVAELSERTRGNPGLLFGLLSGQGALGTGGTSGILELFATRLEQLAPEHRAVLELATAQGDSFDPLAVAETGRVDPRALDAALVQAEQLGLVVSTQGNRRMVLAHPGLRDLLRAQGAQSWLAPGQPRPALDGPDRPAGIRDPMRAWQDWLELARAAAARGQHDQAADHAARAVAVLESAGRAKSSECLDALLAWGSNLARCGNAQHRDVLLDATELALSLGDTARAAQALLARSAALVPTSVAQPDERVAGALREVLRRRLPRATRARLLGALAGELVWDRPLAERQTLVRRAWQLAGQADDPQLQADVAVAGHLATAWPGNLVARRRAARQLLAWARLHDDAALEVRARLFLADAAIEAGHLAPAAELGAAEILAARLAQHYPWEVRFRQAGLALLIAPLEVAESAAQRAFDAGQRGGAPEEGVLAVFGAQLALLRFEQGRLEELTNLLDAVQNGRPRWGVWQVARCFALTELGRHEEARDLLAPLGSDGFTGIVPNMAQLGCLTLLGLSAAELGEPEHCASLARQLRPYRHHLAWGLAVSAGPVALAYGRLLGRLGEPDQARCVLARAASRCRDAGAHRWAARVEAALTRLPR